MVLAQVSLLSCNLKWRDVRILGKKQVARGALPLHQEARAALVHSDLQQLLSARGALTISLLALKTFQELTLLSHHFRLHTGCLLFALSKKICDKLKNSRDF